MSYQDELQHVMQVVHHDARLTPLQRLLLLEQLEMEEKGYISEADPSPHHFQRLQSVLDDLVLRHMKNATTKWEWFWKRDRLTDESRRVAASMLHAWFDQLDAVCLVYKVEKPCYIIKYKSWDIGTSNPWKDPTLHAKLLGETQPGKIPPNDLSIIMDTFITCMEKKSRIRITSRDSLHRIGSKWIWMQRDRKYQWMKTYTRFLEETSSKKKMY